jgi:hypothetical protein
MELNRVLTVHSLPSSMPERVRGIQKQALHLYVIPWLQGTFFRCLVGRKAHVVKKFESISNVVQEVLSLLFMLCILWNDVNVICHY